MTTLTIPINDSLLNSAGRSEKQMQGELKLILAAKLYELGRVTLGQAAEIAGVTQWTLAESLPLLGVSVCNTPDSFLLDDIR